MKQMVKHRDWLLVDTLAVLAITIALAFALAAAALIALSVTGDSGAWVSTHFGSPSAPATTSFRVGFANLVAGPLIGTMLLCASVYRAVRRFRTSF
jgi:hypothetical protein